MVRWRFLRCCSLTWAAGQRLLPRRNPILCLTSSTTSAAGSSLPETCKREREACTLVTKEEENLHLELLLLSMANICSGMLVFFYLFILCFLVVRTNNKQTNKQTTVSLEEREERTHIRIANNTATKQQQSKRPHTHPSRVLTKLWGPKKEKEACQSVLSRRAARGGRVVDFVGFGWVIVYNRVPPKIAAVASQWLVVNGLSK